METFDCRDEVFIDRGFEVLGSVVQATQMALPDPLDVGNLHAEARGALAATLQQVRGSATSRILLIRGEAGCGKTHLIRALRAQVHAARTGVIAYVHMTAEHGDYRQYLLRQVVRSLSDPYDLRIQELGAPAENNGLLQVLPVQDSQQASALDRISDALMTYLEPGAGEKLREADDTSLSALVSDYADTLSEIEGPHGKPRFDEVALNTLRIFLYRQSTRKPIQRRVGSFLNGEPLGDMDWQKLAALPRDCDRGPMLMLGQLARIVSVTLAAPLILCVDQIEASDLTGQNHAPFLNAMSTACELIENVPGMMVLLSCLDSAYDAHAPSLIGSYRHRIENDPSTVTLRSGRSADEIRQIISRRLQWLYESVGLEHIPPNSVYPLPEDMPERLTAAGWPHLRKMLQQIHGYWEQCHAAQRIVEWKPQALAEQLPVSFAEPDVDRLRIEWNEFRTAENPAVSEEDEEQIALLAWALGEIANELEEGARVQVDRVAVTAGLAPLYALSLDIAEPRAEPRRRLIGLCDKDPRGGGLAHQIETLESLRADDQPLVVARSTRFPHSGKIARYIKQLTGRGDVFVTIDDAGWRTLQAMRLFLEQRAGLYKPAVLREWRKTDGPLINLPEIAAILQLRRPGLEAPAGGPARASSSNGDRPARPEAPVRTPPSTAASPRPIPELPRKRPRMSDNLAVDVDDLPPAEAAQTEPPPHLVAESLPAEGAPGPESVAPLNSTPLTIGQTDSFTRAEVLIDPRTLTRHTAIFGANGSGKTVLGLTIVEQLLERGVAVVLFDRKGDLATYAMEDAWTRETGAPGEHLRRSALRRCIDVHLYTPGCPTGRPLILPLLPTRLGELAPDDRQETARQAASILTDVCSPSASRTDQFATVLCRAIELLCADDTPRTLDDLQDVLLQAPQELLALLPAHAPRHCEEVGRRLNERRVAHGRLFSDHGEALDLARMLRPHAGRTPLHIINTQFLDGDASLIWVAQFLAAAGRFIMESPAPDGQLQALLMFDEADHYIPANRKPATKPGMENLLRRARASGLGIMLASQNVGDFDYKALDNITTVFAGKLTTPRAMEKLRSRFGDTVTRLPKKPCGHFLMGMETEIREIQARMSLIRPNPVPRDQIETLASARLRS